MHTIENVPFNDLADKHKIELLLSIVKQMGTDMTKAKFTIQYHTLEDLSDQMLSDYQQTCMKNQDYEKAALVRDELKRRENVRGAEIKA